MEISNMACQLSTVSCPLFPIGGIGERRIPLYLVGISTVYAPKGFIDPAPFPSSEQTARR